MASQCRSAKICTKKPKVMRAGIQYQIHIVERFLLAFWRAAMQRKIADCTRKDVLHWKNKDIQVDSCIFFSCKLSQGMASQCRSAKICTKKPKGGSSKLLFGAQRCRARSQIAIALKKQKQRFRGLRLVPPTLETGPRPDPDLTQT